MRGAVVAFAVLAGCASFTSGTDDAATSTIDAGADAGPDATTDGDGGLPDGAKDGNAPSEAGPGQIIVANVSAPAFVAADDAMVVYGSDDGVVWRAEIDGKNNGMLSNYGGAPRQILIEGTEVIWGDHTAAKQGIWRMVMGNAVRKAGALSVTGLARFAGGFATFDNANGFLVRSDDNGSSPSLIGQYSALYDLISDGDDVVWTVSGTASVWRASANNDAPAKIADSESDVRAVARNSDGIYWTLGSTTVRNLDRVSSVRSNLALGEENVHGLIADDTGVYWLTKGSLRRFSQGKIETLATGFETPAEDTNLARVRKIALTPSFVFFLTKSDLRRVPK